MTALTATGTLLRLNLRRDRVLIVLSAIAFVAWTILVAQVLQSLYPTAAERAQFSHVVAESPAVRAIRGDTRGLETTGQLVAFQVGVLFSTFIAVVTVLLVGRHARGDEESGRTELLLASVAGRDAPLTAGLLSALLLNVLIGVGTAAGLVVLGLPIAGAAAMGAAYAGVGLTFAGVAAVAAQLAGTARGANTLAIGAIIAAYLLRAAGDAGNGTLSWLSPIGWSSRLRAFDHERWWVLGLFALTTVGLVLAAYALLARRDLGAGMLPQRLGRPQAGARFGSPLALALRLERAVTVAWITGVSMLAIVYGLVTSSVADFVQNPQVARIFTQAGADTVVDSYFATVMLVLGLLAGGFAIQATLRPRTEELAGRAEPVLATATSRLRWAGAFWLIALAGVAALLVVSGLVVGIGALISTGDAGDLVRLAGAALAQAPAVAVLAGLAALVHGLAPRAAPFVWIAFAGCVFLGFFGELLDVPAWLRDLSPYTHVPQVPAERVEVPPLLGLSAVAALLFAAAAGTLRRRDMVSD